MSHRRNVRDVGVLRIDNDSRDRAATLQSDIDPMFAAVSRSINAVAPIRRISIVRLAGPDPDDIRIGGRNRDRANRKHWLFVENRVKADASVAGLEDSAVTKRDIKHERIWAVAFLISQSIRAIR